MLVGAAALLDNWLGGCWLELLVVVVASGSSTTAVVGTTAGKLVLAGTFKLNSFKSTARSLRRLFHRRRHKCWLVLAM